MLKLRKLRCSFCGKPDTEVAKLVAGPRVFICDACVAVASRLMEGDGDGETPEAAPTIWRRVSARARRLWRGARSVELPART